MMGRRGRHAMAASSARNLRANQTRISHRKKRILVATKAIT